jgi:hypothetical protein
VRLFVQEDSVRIVHGAWPGLEAPAEEDPWPVAAAAILEGVYAGWFEAQGSPLERTEQIPGREGTLEFRHAP